MAARSSFDQLPVVSDPQELLHYGIVKIPIPTDKISKEQWSTWAHELSQVTPEILAFEGDNEYAFYRNIMDEPDFPFHDILHSQIGDAIRKHFGVDSLHEEIRLDDSFCVHYNTEQADTSGAKHTDPSDITVNLCLEKDPETKGSFVCFYGRRAFYQEHEPNETNHLDDSSDVCFLVRQDEGYATIHWGDHPHETTPLVQGRRTNIILTYWYSEPGRSKAASRTCYT